MPKRKVKKIHPFIESRSLHPFALGRPAPASVREAGITTPGIVSKTPVTQLDSRPKKKINKAGVIAGGIIGGLAAWGAAAWAAEKYTDVKQNALNRELDNKMAEGYVRVMKTLQRPPPASTDIFYDAVGGDIIDI